jgi:probable HAF family extracellular repeat protein
MAFRWDVISGRSLEDLGELPTGGIESEAFAASERGDVVVGDSRVENPDDPTRDVSEAFLWRRGWRTGLGFLEVPLDKYESVANGVSDDGKVVVGVSRVTDPNDSAKSVKAGFIWEGGALVPLGFLADDGNHYESKALSVSGDGKVVIGFSKNTDPNDAGKSVKEAFRWEDGEMVGLGFLETDTDKVESEATATSYDGTWIVGRSKVKDPADPAKSVKQAFLWSEDLGMQALGFLASGTEPAAGKKGKKKVKFESTATGVSDDGSVVVGESHALGGKEAFIWTEAEGMRSLKEVLAAENSEVDLTDWVFNKPPELSHNGRVVAGLVTNPDGNAEAFMATVPEPAGGLFAGLALLAWLGWRRSEAS